jgi:hypothetical protein
MPDLACKIGKTGLKQPFTGCAGDTPKCIIFTQIKETLEIYTIWIRQQAHGRY